MDGASQGKDSAHGGSQSLSSPTEVLEQRLHAIVHALGGHDVGADGKELWFEPACVSGLQIRLGGDRRARCYDRSANFAISYGGELSNGPVSSDFIAALGRIKAIDNSVIDGVTLAFDVTAQSVVRQFARGSAAVESAALRADWSLPTRESRGTASSQSGGDLRSVIVVGGGTAGYFAALTLKRALPDLDVTLVESSKIPIVGVGEATTTLMPPFLHLQLGVDIVELYREVRPTWKLGIKFDWGLPADWSFIYPFGDGNPVEAYAHDGDIDNQSVCSMMMRADRVPIVRGDDGEPISLLEYMPFAYHLENKAFVAYLKKLAQRTDIHHIDAEIREAVATPDGERVDRLILDDGRALCADLYVDASGFRSLLIGKALGSQFLSFTSSLFCDAAVVGEVPQQGVIEPYTTAETMEAGWCWRIPVEGVDHRGYVFSSAHITADQAHAEMCAKNPGLGETWTLRFRSGRHQEFWKGNTVAVGNAYGFVEPLESTALHMVIMELRCLLRCLRTDGDVHWDRPFANKSVGEHWDYLRWFLAIHYKYNRKNDSAFWRACRETVDVSGIEPLLDHLRSIGVGKEAHLSPHVIPDPVFNYHGVVTMLLGQQALPLPPTATWLSKAQWEARVAESRGLVGRAFTQAQALELLRRRPDILQRLTSADSRAWIIPRTPDAEFLKVPGFWLNRAIELHSSVDTKAASGQKSSGSKAWIPYGHLLESVAPPASG